MGIIRNVLCKFLDWLEKDIEMPRNEDDDLINPLAEFNRLAERSVFVPERPSRLPPDFTYTLEQSDIDSHPTLPRDDEEQRIRMAIPVATSISASPVGVSMDDGLSTAASMPSISEYSFLYSEQRANNVRDELMRNINSWINEGYTVSNSIVLIPLHDYEVLLRQMQMNNYGTPSMGIRNDITIFCSQGGVTVRPNSIGLYTILLGLDDMRRQRVCL